MRRFRPVMLILSILLLATALMAAAYAEDSYFDSLATVQGEIFTVRDGELSVYDGEIGDFRSTGKKVSYNTVLADSPDGLFLFYAGDRLLVQLETEAPYSETGRWELTAFQPEDYDEIYRAAVVDDVLYLLTFDGTSDSFRGLLACELKSGRISECPVPSVADMTCARDDSLVICSAPLGREGCLYTWRLDREAEEICSIPSAQTGMTGGLAYHAGNGKVFLRVGDIIYSVDKDEMKEAAYTAEELQADPEAAAVTEDLLYMQCCGDAALVKQQITGEMQQVLRIAGYLNDESLISAYRKENPDVAVVCTGDDPYDELNFNKKVLSGNLNADLIVISTSSTLLQSLIRKQYVVPVDTCAPVTELLERMYPRMQEQVTQQGQYYGLPVGVTAETMGYQPGLFEELGLSVPHSVEELLEFVRNASVPDNVALWSDPLGSFKDELLQETIDIAFSKGTESDLAAVKKLLEMWERVDDDETVSEEEGFGKALFVRHCDAVPGRDNMLAGNARFLLLSPLTGQEPVMPASMEVILVYAGTDQQALCMDFLSFCAKHLEDSTRIALLEDENEPVMKTGAEEELKELRDQTNEIAGMLEEEPDNEALKERQEELLSELKDLQENPWEISPEEIEAYRKVAPCFVFNDDCWHYDTKNLQCYELREQLRTHQISTEEFVNRYRNLMWMLVQEGQ